MSQKNNKQLQQQQNNNTLKVVQAQAQYYAGPLPHPDTLKKFEEIVPGSANRILTQFELQSEHRRSLEKQFSFHEIIKSYVGIACGFIIGGGTVGGGIFLATKGLDLLGGIIGTGGIVALVSVFVYGTKSRRKSLDQHK